MDDTLLKIFIAVTTLAVVLQAGILLGLYLAVRKTTAKMEALATQITGKTVPTLETVQSMLLEMRPKLDMVTTNVTESSIMVRNQLSRFDATLTDALDRTRLQVIRADELLNRTMDRVEETSDVVHKTVLSPSAPGQWTDERNQHRSRSISGTKASSPEERRGRIARRRMFI